MIKLFKIVSLFIFSIFLFGCLENNSDLLQKIEQIKKVGDDNPKLALTMLDSLTIQVREESEYAQMKYFLLKIRLNDKAYIPHQSDITAKKVLLYFENNGSDMEKQEAYYYAGSVYRDLQDTPRALENYYKSVDVATDGNKCDSTILRNTYSQISYLLWSVQDYQRSNEYAKKEYKIAKSLNKVTINSLMHLGVTYQYLDSVDKAKEWLDKAYNKLIESEPVTDVENIYNLIYNYSRILDYKQATACYELSKKLPANIYYAPNYKNLGSYFVMINQPDSAILCYKHVIDNNNDLFTIYDTSKNLFSVYYKLGKYKEAAYYANIFRHASDTLDLGRRQELAATVNNQFQYHYDKEKEQKMKEEKERLHYIIIIISVAAVLGLSLLGLLLIYRKNRNLKKMLKLSKELDDMKTSQEMLMEKISEKEEELSTTEQSYNNAKEELKAVNEKLKEVTNEVEEQKKELKAKETELAERLKQNNTYMKLLHQSELEDKAQEIVESIKQTSEGLKQMSATDWKQLIQAVDELYPDFHGQVKKRVKRLTEQRMQVCYLMKIGLDKKQIQNMVNTSRSSMFRWHDKEFMWIIEENEK